MRPGRAYVLASAVRRRDMQNRPWRHRNDPTQGKAMNTKTPCNRFDWRQGLLAAMIGLLVWPQLGCAGDYGRLSRDPAVTAAFKEGRFSSDYRFYYVGRENQPYALVGIAEGYAFRSKFWKTVDPGTETFRKMVDHPYGFQHRAPYGAYILDSKGNRVGVWFSAFDLANVRVTDDRGVIVHNPYSPTRGTAPAFR
jgi:hypothetical protein